MGEITRKAQITYMGRRTIERSMLLDSGANPCFLKTDDAKALGIVLTKEWMFDVRSSHNFRAYGPYQIEISTGGIRRTAVVETGFSDKVQRIIGHNFFQATGMDLYYDKERKKSRARIRGFYVMEKRNMPVPRHRWSYRLGKVDGEWHVVKKIKIRGRIVVREVSTISQSEVRWYLSRGY